MGIYDTDDDDDDLDEVQEDRRNQSNNAMREVRRALKAAQEQNKLLQEQLAAQVQANRSRSISDVLASKGLSNPKIAKLIPDSIEATPEAVATWLEEYADVFTPKAPEPQQPPQATATAVLPEVMSQLADIDAVSTGGATPQGMGDLMSKIAGANSAEELAAVLRGAAG